MEENQFLINSLMKENMKKKALIASQKNKSNFYRAKIN